jgi:hypothetical protein
VLDKTLEASRNISSKSDLIGFLMFLIRLTVKTHFSRSYFRRVTGWYLFHLHCQWPSSPRQCLIFPHKNGLDRALSQASPTAAGFKTHNKYLTVVAETTLKTARLPLYLHKNKVLSLHGTHVAEHGFSKIVAVRLTGCERDTELRRRNGRPVRCERRRSGGFSLRNAMSDTNE